MPNFFNGLTAVKVLALFMPVMLDAQSGVTKKYLCKGAWDLIGTSYDYTTCTAFNLEHRIVSGKLKEGALVSKLVFNGQTDSVENLETGIKLPFRLLDTLYRRYLIIGGSAFRVDKESKNECMIAAYSFQYSIGGLGCYFRRTKTNVWKRIFKKREFWYEKASS